MFAVYVRWVRCRGVATGDWRILTALLGSGVCEKRGGVLVVVVVEAAGSLLGIVEHIIYKVGPEVSTPLEFAVVFARNLVHQFGFDICKTEIWEIYINLFLSYA